MADWEQASRNSASEIRPNAVVKGCFYHYTSAVQKRFQKLGLSSESNYPASRKTINHVLCLPLLPSNKIVETFNEIKRDNPPQTLAIWLQYVERQWIIRHGSENLSVNGLQDRTNNYAESTFANYS